MPTITRDRIRLELHLDRDGSLIDKLTDATPLLWRGTDTQFELAVFFDGVLMDPSTLSSLRLQVKPADNRTGTALMDKTITTFNAALTQANWDNKTDQHCVVSFLNSETNFVIGADSKDYWLVVTALTTDVPARKVTLGTSTITVVESGSTDGSTPPAGDPLYYTGAQSDARYVLKGGDTMTGLLQWSGTGHAGLKLNNLTTAQRDLLTPAAGNLIYNTTDGRPQFRDGSAWTEFAKRSGDTFTGAVTVTALTIGALAGVLKATAGAVAGSATTSDLPEGTNLYYTQARFDTAFAAKTTTNLAEGTNLYFTNARVDSRITSTWRGLANGLASLDSGGKIPTGELPPLAITEVFVVASQAAMLALTAQRGDVAIRTDINKNFILSTDDPTVLANWKELLTPPDAVLSVNGQTGNVVLTTTNINEGTNLYYTDARARTAVGVTQPYVANGILHATSTTAIGTSGNLIFDGTNLKVGTGGSLRIIHAVFAGDNGIRAETLTATTGVARLYARGPHAQGEVSLEWREDTAGGSAMIQTGKTNNTPQLAILTGNVIVGSVTDLGSGKLQVYGGLTFNGAQTIQTSTGNLTIQPAGSTVFASTSGSVGVGTSTLWGKFNVDYTSTSRGVKIRDSGQTGSVTDAHETWIGLVVERVYTSGSAAGIAVTGATVANGGTGRIHLGNADDWDNTYIDGGANAWNVYVGAVNPLSLTTTNTTIRSGTNGNILLSPNGTGNVGISATFKSFHTSYQGRILQLGATAGLWGTSGTDAFLAANYYINTAGTDSAFTTGGSANVFMSGGTITLRVAASVAADTAVTWVNGLVVNNTGTLTIVSLTASKFVKTDASKNLISGDVDWADLVNKPATFTPSAHTHNAADVVGGTLAMGTDSWILLQGSVTTAALLAFRVAADANYRFLVGTDGQLEWGAGAAARDVRLWRSAAGNIRTDGNLTIDGLTASKFVKTDSTKKLISADVDWADIINKPSTFTPAAHTHDTADITTGILGSARGGTGNGFAKISGPAASEKTFTLPNESLSILTADSGTGTKTVSTVGSQTVTLHSFTLASGKTCLIIAEVVAHRDDHAASVAYVRRAVFRNNAGTVSQIGSTTDEYTNEDASETALDVLVNFSGTTIQVQVVGRTSANLQWRGNIRVAIA